jgi:curved DNA-binding protein CbpA
LDSKGYYAIIGVSEQAKYYEIKAAYRRLAKKYHPDVSHSNNSHSSGSLTNEDMIKKINAAYEVLSDKDKRNEYDHNEVYDDSIIDGNTNDNDLQQQDNKTKADIGKDDGRPDDKSEKDNIGSSKKHGSTYHNVYSIIHTIHIPSRKPKDLNHLPHLQKQKILTVQICKKVLST